MDAPISRGTALSNRVALAPNEAPNRFLLVITALERCGFEPVYDARGDGSMLRAKNDVEAVAEFLAEYRTSPNTFRSYQKELERFLLWCHLVGRVCFADLDRSHIREYEAFLTKPPADWINPKRPERTSVEWRPFRGPLAGRSLEQALGVVNTLLDYLVAAEYIRGNPMALVRRRVKAHAPQDRTVREKRGSRHRLTTGALQYVVEYFNRQPMKTPRQIEERWRGQLVFEYFILTGARRMELTGATLDNLECEDNRWWLYVHAKGGGIGKLPICRRALETIKQYRECRGLPPLPLRGEDRPLIAKLGQPDQGLTDNMVYRIVRTIMTEAAALAKARGDENAEHQLKGASTHWLRHTTLGSMADETKDFRLVKQLGRHVSADSTMRYMREEDNLFHDAIVPHLDELFGGLFGK